MNDAADSYIQENGAAYGPALAERLVTFSILALASVAGAVDLTCTGKYNAGAGEQLDCKEVLAPTPPPVVVPPPVVPSPGLVFSTSFERATDWFQVDPRGTAAQYWYPNLPGVTRHGNWTAPGGKGDEISDAANYPGGKGGKGFRHYRGNGANVNGGGVKIELASPVSKLWLRMYMRYSSGFAWTNGRPHYIKDHYWQSGANQPIFGYYGGWGFYASGNHGGSVTWAQSQGGSLGSGQWNCYEYHIDQTTGTLQLWFNGKLALNKTGLSLGAPGLQYFALGENQNEVTGANPLHYTDYDDIVISTAGRIGC